MTNDIYLRIGKPKRFREQKEHKPMNPILVFVIKWALVIGTIYFLLKII